MNESGSFTCGGCDNVWSGLRRCHCAACHVSFGGLISFDAHRKYNKCLKPESLGLTDNGKGVWTSNYVEVLADEE